MSIFSNLNNTIKNGAGLVGLKVSKYSPEIFLGVGIAGIIGGTVMACKATIKAQDILDDAREQLQNIEIAKECAVNTDQTYTDEDARKDKTVIFARTGIELAKEYGPAVILTTVGIACVIGGHHILKKRNLALMAAYKAIDEGYKRYQERVKEKFGQKIANELKYGIEEKEITVEKKKKDGKVEKVKKTKKAITNPTGISPYAKFFDESCRGWENDAEFNLTFLKGIQNQMNDLLIARKFVTLNDVYDALGIPRTSAGQEVGWVMGGDGDNYIDFGIFRTEVVKNRDFVNGYEPVILLDFNVDGVIRDKIDEINGVRHNNGNYISA